MTSTATLPLPDGSILYIEHRPYSIRAQVHRPGRSRAQLVGTAVVDAYGWSVLRRGCSPAQAARVVVRADAESLLAICDEGASA